jgi:two-component system, LytTR family, response regulator
LIFRTLIADDEAAARRHLAALLRREPDVELVGEAPNGIEALRLLDELPVDLLFLDVQMPGLDGFQVLRRARARPLVVFTTARDEYALEAFRANAVEYLLKPLAPEELKRAMQKVRQHAYARLQSEDAITRVLRDVDMAKSVPAQILVSVRDTLRPLRLDQIICLEARDKCTTIYTAVGEHETDKGLGDLEARLPSADFVRIHRRHIVNIRYIKELRKWGNRQYKVELTTPVPVELYVSRRCVDDVLQRLGGTA